MKFQMDADSSYGGSDTHSAHETSSNFDHNNQQPATTTTTNTMATHPVNDESQYYHKNEITLPVHYDETDFQTNNKKEPHYMSTINLNIKQSLENHSNLEEMSKNYRSTNYLNKDDDEDENNITHQKMGLENPAFEAEPKSTFDQTKPYNGEKINGQMDEKPMTEAVNLELINLKPMGKDVAGPYENGVNGIPTKKIEEELEVGSPYDEYFVPVNEHRKYISDVTFADTIADEPSYIIDDQVEYPRWMAHQRPSRGEKLYLTMDKRNKKSRHKCLCWLICLCLVAAGLILGILAAVGVFANHGPMEAKEITARKFSGNETPIKGAGLFGIRNNDTILTGAPPLGTAPNFPPTTDITMIEVPRALESEVTIENLEFNDNLKNHSSVEYQNLAKNLEDNIKKTLFANDVLKYGTADIEVKVIDFNPGSVIVTYRVAWKFKEGIHNARDPISKEMLSRKMNTAMIRSNGYLDTYHLRPSQMEGKKIIDKCQIQNNGCHYGCQFDYDGRLDFVCTCPNGMMLGEDEKSCELMKPTSVEPEPAAEPAPEPSAEPEPSPDPKVSSEATTTPVAEPSPEPSAAPEPAPEPKAASEATTTPVAEPSPEPSAAPEPAPELKAASDATTTPVAEPSPEPSTAPEPAPEPKAASEATTTPVAEPSPEPSAAPEPAPEPKAAPEATTTPVAEPIPSSEEPKPEPASQPATESPVNLPDFVSSNQNEHFPYFEPTTIKPVETTMLDIKQSSEEPRHLDHGILAEGEFQTVTEVPTDHDDAYHFENEEATYLDANHEIDMNHKTERIIDQTTANLLEDTKEKSVSDAKLQEVRIVTHDASVVTTTEPMTTIPPIEAFMEGQTNLTSDEPIHNQTEHILPEQMSPFLPEIENDTLVNILHNDEHFIGHHYVLNDTEKPPTLDNDQLNHTNPFDLHPTDTTVLGVEPLNEENEINEVSETATKSTTTTTTTTKNPTLPSDIINNVHSNSYFEKEFKKLLTTTMKSQEVTTMLVEVTTTTDEMPTTTMMEEEVSMETTTVVTEASNVTEQYQVVENTTADITTTERLFLTKKTTVPSTVVEEDLAVAPLDSFNNISPDEDKFKPTEAADEATTLEILQREMGEYEKIDEKDLFDPTLRTIDMDDLYSNDTSSEDVTAEATTGSDIKPVTEDFTLFSFARCSSGQFQCVNGTTIKDGSYCIPDTDRCDSIPHCSDGSDETNCTECRNNFKCHNGQCLKRHLVCDGITNCLDGSDELSCETHTCNSDEFSCKGRCLPLSWRCDGNSQCLDGSDEVDCPTNDCDGFQCPEKCIPNSWRCDGMSDCLNGVDESLCDCKSNEFKCQSGGCIQEQLQCDGEPQCPDRSDEWNCFSLNKTILTIQMNQTYLPICLDEDNWNDTEKDSVCQMMGYSGAVQMGSTNLTESEFYQLSNEEGETLLKRFRKVDNCSEVATLQCQDFACGSTTPDSIPQARILGGDKAAATQWPSLTLLYNKKLNIQCTSTLIAPMWAMASYSCVAPTSDDWVLYAGSTNFFTSKSNITSRVQEIIKHPQLKYHGFQYENDVVLVKLQTPLTLGSNVSTACLPERPIEPRELCVLSGWSVNKPGDEQILHYLPIPIIDTTECNSTKHYNGLLREDKICAGYADKEKSPCYSDEGAPLMCFVDTHWELHGILSHHDNCGMSKHPAIYSAIYPNIRTWIINTIGEALKK